MKNMGSLLTIAAILFSVVLIPNGANGYPSQSSLCYDIQGYGVACVPFLQQTSRRRIQPAVGDAKPKPVPGTFSGVARGGGLEPQRRLGLRPNPRCGFAARM